MILDERLAKSHLIWIEGFNFMKQARRKYAGIAQSFAITTRLQNFDRQECIMHSCWSQCFILGDIVITCYYKVFFSNAKGLFLFPDTLQ